jgi:hypothetical protein
VTVVADAIVPASGAVSVSVAVTTVALVTAAANWRATDRVPVTVEADVTAPANAAVSVSVPVTVDADVTSPASPFSADAAPVTVEALVTAAASGDATDRVPVTVDAEVTLPASGFVGPPVGKPTSSSENQPPAIRTTSASAMRYPIKFVATPDTSHVQTPAVPGLIDSPTIKLADVVSNPADTPDCPYAGWTARPVAARACPS